MEACFVGLLPHSQEDWPEGLSAVPEVFGIPIYIYVCVCACHSPWHMHIGEWTDPVLASVRVLALEGFSVFPCSPSTCL